MVNHSFWISVSDTAKNEIKSAAADKELFCRKSLCVKIQREVGLQK